VKVVVTGAAGFIGSNLVHGLNARGIDDIVAVDDLTDGSKHLNLTGASIADYVEHDEFYGRFERGEFGRADIVFHQGACSDTMVHDGRFMMQANYRSSKRLLDACLASGTRLVYASSAAVYGASETFREEPAWERPLNVYGYSKLLFDQVVRRALPGAPVQVAGLRYFNVYGPREQHKGRMASVAFHQHGQFDRDGHVNLFGAYGGFDAGQQRRDFVFVDDVVAVNLWLLEQPRVSGIFNVGSGRAQPFNDIAHAVVNAGRQAAGQAPLALPQQVEQQLVRYVEFPPALVGKYQCHTQADLTRLRAAGYDAPFVAVAEGVARYARWLLAQGR
jgi:ADP-L-glycero-D-manno-heptose 6-epimerase